MTITIGFITVFPQEPMDPHITRHVTTLYTSAASVHRRWFIGCDQRRAVDELVHAMPVSRKGNA
jgi:hypothetical protein